METSTVQEALGDTLAAIDAILDALQLAVRSTLTSQREGLDIARAGLRVREARARLEADGA